MAKPKPKPAKTSKPARASGKRWWLLVGGGAVVIAAAGGIAAVAFRLAQGPARDAGQEIVQPTGPLGPADRPATVVSFEDGCATSRCHTLFLNATGAHEPTRLGACDQCHLPDAGGHTFPLKLERDQLCLSCHEGFNHKLVRHSALTSQGCLACHDPHRSDAPVLLTGATLADTCSACHPAPKGNVKHEPFATGECVACHEPHESDFAGLLRGGEGMDHCLMCHDSLVESVKELRHTHSEIEGQCEACHDPHATSRESLLTRDAGVGCLECHDDVRAAVEGATVTHGAVMTGERCVSCHNPHAADIPDMLRDRQAIVCLECHNKEQRDAGGRVVMAMSKVFDADVVHGPVKLDQCSACHSVHGSTRERLLKELSPRILSGGFDLRNYALCFQCHDQNMVLEERSESATQFRNGDKNLHYVHIAKVEQSRSCTQCHAVHASGSARLIAQKVAYQGSDWMMDMNFEIRADGGSCGPGCHEPLSYSREPKALPELPGGEP